MGRKKKKKKAQPEAAGLPSAPKRISRPFAEALRGLSLEEPGDDEARAGEEPAKRPAAPEAPPSPGPRTQADAEYSYEDRAAFNVAFADVAPLGSKKKAKKRGKKPERDAPADGPRRVSKGDVDADARARLAALVAGGLRFEVRRDDGWVEGRREDAPKSRLADLRNGRATPEVELDLHGMTGDEAVKALVAFLRREQGRGRTIVRIIHGKGLHSEGGVGVLGDRVIRAITDGLAGPLVHAFVTAAIEGGGSGALLLRLETR